MLKMDFRSISMDTGMPIQVEFTAFFRGFETLSKMEEKSIGPLLITDMISNQIGKIKKTEERKSSFGFNAENAQKIRLTSGLGLVNLTKASFIILSQSNVLTILKSGNYKLANSKGICGIC